MPEIAVKEHPILFSDPMVKAILNTDYSGPVPRPIDPEGPYKSVTRRVIKPHPPQPFSKEFRGSDFGLCRSIADGVKMYSVNQYEHLPKHPTDWDLEGSVGVAREAGYPMRYRCPYGGPGDRLWGRETWADVNSEDGPALAYRANKDIRTWHEFSKKFGPDYGAGPSFDYEAYPGNYTMWWSDLLNGAEGHSWNPSIHMPRWATRLLFENTRVRVERVQDITEEDAIAEGIEWKDVRCGDDYQDVYRNYLDKSEEWPWITGDPIASYRSLWNAINAHWKPIKKRANGKWVLSHYECFPWDEESIPPLPKGADPSLYRPTPNPWVFAIDFKRIVEGES